MGLICPGLNCLRTEISWTELYWDWFDLDWIVLGLNCLGLKIFGLKILGLKFLGTELFVWDWINLGLNQLDWIVFRTELYRAELIWDWIEGTELWRIEPSGLNCSGLNWIRALKICDSLQLTIFYMSCVEKIKKLKILFCCLRVIFFCNMAQFFSFKKFTQFWASWNMWVRAMQFIAAIHIR